MKHDIVIKHDKQIHYNIFCCCSFAGIATEQTTVLQTGEVIVVSFILLAWVLAIALFLRKWGKIRIIQSGETHYKTRPKNLDTIKIVKRQTDSIIYRNPSQQLSMTMEAREKRLARMNTMPLITKPVPMCKPLQRLSTVPTIEVRTYDNPSRAVTSIIDESKDLV